MIHVFSILFYIFYLPLNVIEVKGKGKFVPVHAIKAYGEVKA